jgi:hypothetical protein
VNTQQIHPQQQQPQQPRHVRAERHLGVADESPEVIYVVVDEPEQQIHDNNQRVYANLLPAQQRRGGEYNFNRIKTLMEGKKIFLGIIFFLLFFQLRLLSSENASIVMIRRPCGSWTAVPMLLDVLNVWEMLLWGRSSSSKTTWTTPASGVSTIIGGKRIQKSGMI